LRVYNGATQGFDNGSTLKQWGGGFVDNSGAAYDLVIPLISTTGGRSAEHGMDFDGGWLTELKLNAGVMETRAGFGMHPEAKDEKDRFDVITAPRFFNYLELNFYHPENVLPKFSQDVIAGRDQHVWEFSVETNLEETVTLSWGEIPEEIEHRELFLLDISQNRIVDMMAENSYTFTQTRKRDFKIAYGDDLFVKETLMPEKVTMGASQPNPFDKSTIIPFTLPESRDKSLVILKVYDLFGKEVRELVNTDLEPGYYRVEWDGTEESGTRASSGVFITILYVNDGKNKFSLTGKIFKK